MPLPILFPAILALTPAPAAQKAKPPAKKDYGSVTLGSEVYRFKPETLSASSGKPMALYLKGELVPVKGGKTLAFSFQLFRPGPLAGMMLGPRTGSGAHWVANLKSKVDADFPNPPKLGDVATFTLSGPMVRSEGSKSTELTWQGQIRAAFTSVP